LLTIAESITIIIVAEKIYDLLYAVGTLIGIVVGFWI